MARKHKDHFWPWLTFDVVFNHLRLILVLGCIWMGADILSMWITVLKHRPFIWLLVVGVALMIAVPTTIHAAVRVRRGENPALFWGNLWSSIFVVSLGPMAMLAPPLLMLIIAIGLERTRITPESWSTLEWDDNAWAWVEELREESNFSRPSRRYLGD